MLATKQMGTEVANKVLKSLNDYTKTQQVVEMGARRVIFGLKWKYVVMQVPSLESSEDLRRVNI